MAAGRRGSKRHDVRKVDSEMIDWLNLSGHVMLT